jgi:hypothetical protein
MTKDFIDVFSHYANHIEVETLRNNIVENVRRCLESGQQITNPDPPLYLYYGSYNLRGNKDVRATLNELIWKYSELTGKYCGCHYWSVKARSLFDKELLEYMNGGKPTLEDACRVSVCLRPKTRVKEKRIVHEHVFPRKQLVDLLLEMDVHSTFDCVKTIIEQLAMGCVVLESEHPKKTGDCNNPWLRYKDNIMLVDNKNWSLSQRKLIEEAELV